MLGNSIGCPCVRGFCGGTVFNGCDFSSFWTLTFQLEIVALIEFECFCWPTRRRERECGRNEISCGFMGVVSEEASYSDYWVRAISFRLWRSGNLLVFSDSGWNCIWMENNFLFVVSKEVFNWIWVLNSFGWQIIFVWIRLDDNNLIFRRKYYRVIIIDYDVTLTKNSSHKKYKINS